MGLRRVSNDYGLIAQDGPSSTVLTIIQRLVAANHPHRCTSLDSDVRSCFRYIQNGFVHRLKTLGNSRRRWFKHYQIGWLNIMIFLPMRLLSAAIRVQLLHNQFHSSNTTTTFSSNSSNHSHIFYIAKNDGSISQLSIQLQNRDPYQILCTMAQSINFPLPPPPLPSTSRI
jgi:hypothetical protein